ncbi:hypothetical protein ACE1SV_72260 [Streptomyces sp. E-15]
MSGWGAGGGTAGLPSGEAHVCSRRPAASRLSAGARPDTVYEREGVILAEKSLDSGLRFVKSDCGA